MTKCKIWTGYKDRNGYGMRWIIYKGRRSLRLVHRLAWEEFYGVQLTKDIHICHHCDVRSCYEITHLYAGNPQTNSDDMIRRKRGKWAQGEAHGLSKLEDWQVKYIRKELKKGTTKISLARRFGVSHTIIGRISKGTAWAHLK
jgi:hypothetical protein